MAIHSANGVVHFLSLPVVHKELLGAIRHWENIEIGFEGETVWVRGLTTAQLSSLEIKTIPRKELYYSSGPNLFKQGSLLPDRTIPFLRWLSLDRGLPVELPSPNHNYFGLSSKIDIRLLPAQKEREAVGLLVDIAVLKQYIETASAVRLKNLVWVIVNGSQAFIMGSPILPVAGKAYWQENDFFLTAGFAFEYPLLTDTLQQAINPQQRNWIVWTEEGTYFEIAKEAVRPLTIYSCRKSEVG